MARCMFTMRELAKSQRIQQLIFKFIGTISQWSGRQARSATSFRGIVSTNRRNHADSSPTKNHPLLDYEAWSDFQTAVLCLTLIESAMLQPFFLPQPNSPESPSLESLIQHLHLQPHPEGGHFVETDRDPLRVSNPFKGQTIVPSDPDSTRSASTTIYYLLTPSNPKGVFHTNKGRTVHTLHKGRGCYVVIHPPNESVNGQKARLETFIVGHDVHSGERLQWIVEGGNYKASFLLPDTDDGSESEGLLISEVSNASDLRSVDCEAVRYEKIFVDTSFVRLWFPASNSRTMTSCPQGSSMICCRIAMLRS